MPTQVPTELLAPYVAAAARQVVDDRDLTPRSAWALEDAKAQLENSKNAIDGGSHGDLPVGRAAVVAASGGNSLELAGLVLAAHEGQPQPTSVEEHEAWASRTLTEVVRNIERVLDRRDVASARALRHVFEAVVERLSAAEFDEAPY